MEFFNKPDDGRQHRRQSKDFNEIVNMQTEMEVKQAEWDRIFHNWENPQECGGRKKILGCEICRMIDNNMSVEHLKPNSLKSGKS